jgi:hypothetical protein
MGPSVWLNGPSGLSTGEVEYTDLQIYTADLTAGEILTIYNLNAVRPLAGYAIRVLNNLYASNAITIVGNISGILMNLTSTLNTGSFTTALIVADELGWSNTNLYISNSITTVNVYTTNVNAASYVGTSGSIGIGTADGGYALKIQGNLASSNTLWSLPDVSALQSIYYADDITKRAPHLRPTPSNAASIQSWISATCNAASQPKTWWSTSSAPIFGNVVVEPVGASSYFGSVLLPDGRVLFIPNNADGVGIYNPTTNEFSSIIPQGFPTGSGTNQFQGGVLLPNGNVVMIPSGGSNIIVFNPVSYAFSNAARTSGHQGGVLSPNGNVVLMKGGGSNIGFFNPNLLTLSNIQPGGGSFSGGVLLPNGNIIAVPGSSTNVGMINPVNLTYSNLVVTNSGTFLGGVLTPNGNVVLVPTTSTNIGVLNPTTGVYSNAGVGIDPTGSKYIGGVMLPTGNVILVPHGASNVGMFDPVAFSFSNCAATGGFGVQKFRGGTLLPDGRIVFCPFSSKNVSMLDTFTPAPVEFCLSPYFNKF